MKLKGRRFLGGFNRFRLMLTLGLAVVLPAAALIYVNYRQLRSFERDKVIEAAIHRDFQEMLGFTEKKMNLKAYTMTEEARKLFPSPDSDAAEREKKFDELLQASPWLDHVFLFSEKGAEIHSQPRLIGNQYIHAEQKRMTEGYHSWFHKDGKMMVESMHKKPRPITIYTEPTKRADGKAFMAAAYFVLPQISKDRVVMGGVCFDPGYLKGTLFPEVLEEMMKEKSRDQANKLAMIVYPVSMDSWTTLNRLRFRAVGAKANPKCHASWTTSSAVLRWVLNIKVPAWKRWGVPG